MLTQSRLKELVSYNQDTGEFSWIEDRAKKIHKNLRSDKDSYNHILIDGKVYSAHRLAWLYMNGKFPVNSIDHINRVKKDNRISNLREATSKQNRENVNPRSDNKSGVNGVGWNKSGKHWMARICHHGKRIYIGGYKTIEEAHEAYKAKAAELFTHSEWSKSQGAKND